MSLNQKQVVSSRLWWAEFGLFSQVTAGSVGGNGLKVCKGLGEMAGKTSSLKTLEFSYPGKWWNHYVSSSLKTSRILSLLGR